MPKLIEWYIVNWIILCIKKYTINYTDINKLLINQLDLYHWKITKIYISIIIFREEDRKISEKKVFYAKIK